MERLNGKLLESCEEFELREELQRLDIDNGGNASMCISRLREAVRQGTILTFAEPVEAFQIHGRICEDLAILAEDTIRKMNVSQLKMALHAREVVFGKLNKSALANLLLETEQRRRVDTGEQEAGGPRLGEEDTGREDAMRLQLAQEVEATRLAANAAEISRLHRIQEEIQICRQAQIEQDVARTTADAESLRMWNAVAEAEAELVR